MKGDWTVGEIKGHILDNRKKLDALVLSVGRIQCEDYKPDLLILSERVAKLASRLSRLESRFNKTRKALEGLLGEG